MAQPLLRPTTVAKAARSQSYLLDLELSPQASRRQRPTAGATSTEGARDAYIQMLSSPARRCILTQKVLPNEMMVQLKLARSDAEGPRPKLAFTPNRVLHPRFAVNLPGRGAWVVCWKEGMEALRRKGSYKRLSASALFPSSTTAKVQSQLARRVTQECKMLAERVKSRPATTTAGAKRPCPVARVDAGVWDAALQSGDLGSLAKSELDLVAVVSLRPSLEGTRDTFSTLYPASDTSTRQIPVYHLTTFFLDTVVPPALPSIQKFTSTSAPEAPSTELLRLATEAPLDSLVDLFARREGAVPDRPPGPVIYALYATKSGAGSDEDTLPLLIALWRCRLWRGEGWRGADEPTAVASTM